MLRKKKSYLIPMLGFLLIILIGTIFLYMPISNKNEILLKDALFTATSALTTTGLTRVVLVDQFNFLGQLILVILMEIGQLGFMIFISYFWSLKDKKMKMSDILLINETINGDNYGLIKEYSIFIFKLMLKVQAIGVGLLAIRFIPEYGIFKGIWYSIFHTISAFSNTGFDLFGNSSLIAFSNDIYVQLVLILLMFLGSIGILVIKDVVNNKLRKFSRLKLQTKIVLIASAFLIIIPTILIKILEPQISILNSLFYSVTSRNTGFMIENLVDFCGESKIILMVLMLIGGGPTSTSGGIKIITFVVAISGILSTLNGKRELVLFNRKISDSIIKKAFTIIFVFLLSIIIASFVIYHCNNIGEFNIVFEAISAITNTGFSITDYSQLNIIGELVLAILMFIGRVGPLSLALIFVNEDKKDAQIEYPSENLIL